MQLYAEREDADTQPIPAVESEPEEAVSPESKSKKRNEPVSGAMWRRGRCVIVGIFSRRR